MTQQFYSLRPPNRRALEKHTPECSQKIHLHRSPMTATKVSLMDRRPWERFIGTHHSPTPSPTLWCAISRQWLAAGRKQKEAHSCRTKDSSVPSFDWRTPHWLCLIFLRPAARSSDVAFQTFLPSLPPPHASDLQKADRSLPALPPTHPNLVPTCRLLVLGEDLNQQS